MQISIMPLSRSGSVSLLADEPAHVVGEMRVLHQRQGFVERLDEPALGGGQDDVEQADDIARHRMSRNPVQRDARHIEVHLAGLDLYGARIDFPFEAVRSQHASEV
jgi:hypothetical protein